MRSRARSADMRTTAAAASLTPGALPAVTVPSFLKAGLRAASASSEVSARTLSSWVEEGGRCAFFGGEGEGNDFGVEAACLLRGGGFAVGVERVSILLLAA